MTITIADSDTADKSSVRTLVDMVWVAGGTFRMGSEKHYPEEAPVHRAMVDGFWIDKTPVTNAQFRQFVRETGYMSFAEIPPDPRDYPGAKPEMLYAGSMVFSPPGRIVDLRDWSQWWQFAERQLASASWTQKQHQRPRRASVVRISSMRWPMPNGQAKNANGSRVGVCRA